MAYIPHTPHDRQEMLETLGLSSIQEQFQAIPEDYRYPPLNLPDGLSEMEVKEALAAIARTNDDASGKLWFLGGGLYRHYIPSVVNAILSRGEFFTAYTPYQPEVSQGTLQGIFEFQTMVGELYAMEVVNASHYDGAAAMAEAALMALRCKEGRKTITLDKDIHPEYKEVLETYLSGSRAVVEYARPNEDSACFIVSNPGFSGELKDLNTAGETAREAGALFVVHSDPLVCGLTEAPGNCGADIVTGEGQPLGIPMSFGGPLLGLFATSKKLVRKMPGRVVGQTMDARGRSGCVLTFSAREQHIRREKATSNICSNQGLMALAAAVYMAALGREGIKETARLIYDKTAYAASLLGSLEGYSLKSPGPFFREFILKCPRDAEKTAAALRAKGIIAGLPLSRFPKEGYAGDELLVCITEMNSREDIDALASAFHMFKEEKL